MANYKDLKGKKFGKLEPIEIVGKYNRKMVWRCKCDCGNFTNVTVDRLSNGMTKSCGCLRDKTGKNVQKHNKENLVKDGVFTPLLKSKVRSDNKTGHKGITIIKRKNKVRYKAGIGIKGKQIHLGYFDKLEDAVKARKKAEEKYHKPYLVDDKRIKKKEL